MKRARVLVPVSLAVLAIMLFVASAGSSEPRQAPLAPKWAPPDWKSPTAPPPQPHAQTPQNAP
ncbi:MAG: hypothetical protein QY323_04970 [Patescibacteria group bacterium]|nr:MAG: hypothetical protein QY323_04970 [Patescibacteria group bacterium]